MGEKPYIYIDNSNEVFVMKQFQSCPACMGTGMGPDGGFCPQCRGDGVLGNLIDTGGQSQSQELNTSLQKLLAKGVIDISEPQAQYEVMSLLSSGNFELEDITDSPDLNQQMKASDSSQTLIINDGLVKSGRTYAIRAKSTSNVLERKVLGYNLDSTVPPGPFVVPLNMNTFTATPGSVNRTARWKKFDTLYLTFWANAARTIRETTLPRTIRLTIVPNFPPKVLQANEVVLGAPINAPDATQPPVITSSMLYQVDATHNPTHQLMSDIVITRPDGIYLPRYYELNLFVGQVAGPCWVDAFIVQKVLR